MQRIYSPTDFHFTWTPAKPGDSFGWYEWDEARANKDALQAAKDQAKEWRGAGYKVRRRTLKNQRIQLGGIGSGKPHLEFVVDCHMVTAL